ncbi:hypothetical protein RJ640_002172, partial [Escallonia rubra]
NLYAHGARNFWIHNTGPLGCLPETLEQFGTDPLDEVGCVIKQNRAAKYFNLQLQVMCSRLQYLYQDAKITYVDIFAIKYNLMVDYTTLGLGNRLESSGIVCGAQSFSSSVAAEMASV